MAIIIQNIILSAINFGKSMKLNHKANGSNQKGLWIFTALSSPLKKIT